MSDVKRKGGARFEDPLEFFPRAMTKLYSLWVSATYPFASIGSNLSIHYTTLLNKRLAHRIKLGSSVIIRKNAWLNILPEAERETNIIIGDHTVINAQCVISAKNCIHLEREIMMSSCALIMDHNHAYEDIQSSIREQGVTPGGTIRIEQGCWIGHGAAIVCNQGELVIGRNSVVAANSLVTRSIPPYSVVVGNPARVVRYYDPSTETWTMGSRGLVGQPQGR